MPNIKTINAPQLGLQDTDRGVDAYTQAGRRVGAFFNQQAEDTRREGAEIGQGIAAAGGAAVDFLDHAQISHGMAEFATLHLNLTKQWEDTLKGADPNDPTVGQKFREGAVEPALEKFTDAFYTEKGQAWAEERANTLRNHFNTKTIADQSTLAMVAAKENIRTMANTYSTSVAIDPSSLPAVLDQADKDLKSFVASSPTLTAEHRAQIMDDVGERIKEGITKAGITAAIAKNPDAGLRMAQDPAYAKYLNGGEVNQFYNEAKRAQKADILNAKQLKEQQLKENTEANSDKILEDIHSDQPKITASQILQMPNDQLNYARRKDLVGAIEKRDNKVEGAEANVGRMIASIHTPGAKPLTEDDVYSALGKGEIKYAGAKQVLKEIKDFTDPEGDTVKSRMTDFFKQYDNVVNPIGPLATGINGRSEDGFKRVQQLHQYTYDQIEAAQAKGEDPRKTVLNPKSKDFIGYSPYASVTSSADLLRNTSNPPTITKSAAGAPAEYKTEADAEAAEKAGTLKKGAKVIIGGKRGTWQ